MKLTRSTLALVAIAVVLGLAALLIERRPDQSDDSPQPLFSFEEDDVQAVAIATDAQTLAFERQDGSWQMVQPEQGPASEASVVYLLNALVTEESSRRLPLGDSEAADFGFDAPLATVDITLDEEQTHRLTLGDYNFSNQFIYALVDPQAGIEEAGDEAGEAASAEDSGARLDSELVHLVSTNFDTAVNRPLEDWRAVPDSEASPESSPESPSEDDAEAVEPLVDETDLEAAPPAP